MANIPYLKGVRTRYVNILKTEVEIAEGILQKDLEYCDKDEYVECVMKCVEKMQVYREKLENQTDKLASALSKEEETYIQTILEEDCSLCEKARDMCMDLKNSKEKLLFLKNKEEELEEKKQMVSASDILKLLYEMKNIVATHMEQQNKMLAMNMKQDKFKSSLKLPKLDLLPYNGDKLKWLEFWDSFECTIHSNKQLSNIEKFTYLRNKLYGEAKRSIAGLALSDENYTVAIEILKDRFGNIQEVIDLHYNQMINLFPASNKTESLRGLLNKVDQHIRSLEVLHQNTEQDVFVSMIRTKLPEEVLLQLEIQKGKTDKWTVSKLREKLDIYVTAREKAEQKAVSQSESRKEKRDTIYSSNTGQHRQKYLGNQHMSDYSKRPNQKGSAEALVTHEQQKTAKCETPNTTNTFNKCRYCDNKHWSDECPIFRTIDERKKKLKGSCFKCLKPGHSSSECKGNKHCVYCGGFNVHHRSLCLQKFRPTEFCAISSETNVSSDVNEVLSENVLISSSEMVLMQTARTEVKGPMQNQCKNVRVLLDSGSQRTYITQALAEKLGIKQGKEEQIKLVTFGTQNDKNVFYTSEHEVEEWRIHRNQCKYSACYKRKHTEKTVKHMFK
ncbi:uncharacterized protein LOC123524328 [Mercenaria mercenaria]|uniref:uncharacterized protein LOC123524328 n=1 Tax=Mercenaria mercenaria TaxID=6596 RepID=UPI00234EB590|nr:uncharacterized protein LOC123524328 [Mercenaria mercenaria]